MTDPVTAVKTTAQQLHVARKELSTAEGRYDQAVAHLALTAEAKRLDAERRLDEYGNRLADLSDRCAQEGVGTFWPEQTAAAKLLMDAMEAARPTAYGPVPNDGEVNPSLGTSRQDPGAMSNGLSGLKHRAGDISEVTG